MRFLKQMSAACVKINQAFSRAHEMSCFGDKVLPHFHIILVKSECTLTSSRVVCDRA